MDRGAWEAIVHGVAKESDTTWRRNSDSVHIFTYGNGGIYLFILEHLHLDLETGHLPVCRSLYPLSCKFLDGGNHILLTSFVKLPAELPGDASS